MFAFEQFPVYLKSEQLVVKLRPIINQTIKFDRELNDQLRRAANSIVLNIAEGAGKQTRKDKAYFYNTARGSTQECSDLTITEKSGNN